MRGSEPGLNNQQAIATLEKEADMQACPTFYDVNRDGADDGTCEGGAKGDGFYGAGLVDALEAVTP